MNILHLACVAPPQTGGIGQAASEITKRLRAEGHDAILLTPDRKKFFEEKDSVWVRRLPASIRWGNAAALRGISPLLKHADIIHLHYPFFGTAEAVAQFALMHPQKPMVMTFHMDATGGNLLTQSVFMAYRLLAQPVILQAAKKIFVSSKDYAEHASIKGFMKRHPEIFDELPFGVDESFFQEHDMYQARQILGLPHEAFIVGFVGGLDHAHPFKGVQELLQAVSELPQNHHVIIIGDGDRRRVFEARAKELGLEGRAHFLGRLPSEQLPLAYASMNVFTLPSTSAGEAFGLVAAEAQASGKPAIVSSLPGVRTVVLDRRTGLHIEPKNVESLKEAIIKLSSNKELLVFYGEEAKQWAKQQFNWDHHVKHLMKVYRELCA